MIFAYQVLFGFLSNASFSSYSVKAKNSNFKEVSHGIFLTVNVRLAFFLDINTSFYILYKK